MTIKMFLTIGAILALGFGVPFLLVPAFVMQVYGITSTPELMLAYRYFGVALVTVAFVIWPVRSCTDSAILRPVLIGHAAGDFVGVLVSAWAGLSGLTNGLAWLNVLIYLGLIAGAVTSYMSVTAARPYATV